MLQSGPSHNEAVLYDKELERWLHFRHPLRVLEVHARGEVQGALRLLEAEVEANGLWAAGFLSYEAAAAFDPACTTVPASDFPLLWFALYAPPDIVELPPPDRNLVRPVWSAGLDGATFSNAIASIKEFISRGETYQVNFTFPLETSFGQDPWPFFLGLVHGQKAAYAAYMDTGRYVIASASPELFFELSGDRLTAKPMKGTAPRGRTLPEDDAQKRSLKASEKNRAENLMILDMIRNDLGRLGAKVQVPELFTLEKYPTLWQMTSSAETRTEAPLEDIFSALFPCASITGAPKYHTMEIISALEQRPRRIYTGAMGFITPGRRARFSVAIRTALIDREKNRAEYGVGAGITWESQADEEYLECLQKSRILHHPSPSFSLLESLLWTPGEGYFLQEEHLQRMADSAAYFDRPWKRDRAIEALERSTTNLSPGPHKVRLLLAEDGTLECQATPLPQTAEEPVRIKLAKAPIDIENPYLYHKTTHRTLYEQALQQLPDCDDVLLWNNRGEITETGIANVVVDLDGDRITPPVTCGLLPGTFRAHLLANGEVREGLVTIETLSRCRQIFLVNSVRGWRRAVLIP